MEHATDTVYTCAHMCERANSSPCFIGLPIVQSDGTETCIGCLRSFQLADIGDHKKHCQWLGACSFCFSQFPIRELAAHESCCEAAVRCQGCLERFPCDVISAHEEICHWFSNCIVCGLKFATRDMSSHIKNHICDVLKDDALMFEGSHDCCPPEGIVASTLTATLETASVEHEEESLEIDIDADSRSASEASISCCSMVYEPVIEHREIALEARSQSLAIDEISVTALDNHPEAMRSKDAECVVRIINYIWMKASRLDDECRRKAFLQDLSDEYPERGDLMVNRCIEEVARFVQLLYDAEFNSIGYDDGYARDSESQDCCDFWDWTSAPGVGVNGTTTTRCATSRNPIIITSGYQQPTIVTL